MSRTATAVSLVAVMLLAFTAGAAAAPPGHQASEREERYLIVFQSGIPDNADELVADAGGTLLNTLPALGLGFATSGDDAFADRVRRQREVRDADVEPRYKLPDVVAGPTASADTSSLDPPPALWELQWNIRRVHAPEAWDTTTGSNDTVVAVIDTGVAWNHPDLEVVRTDCFATPEWEELVGRECSAYPDLSWHGTHVAGTVAAKGNFIAGVGPDLGIASYNVFELMPNPDFDGEDPDEPEYLLLAAFESIAQAMLDAADHGDDVINMSLGAFIDMADGRASAATWTAQQRLAREVARQGVTTVVSAGNAAFSLNGSVKSIPGGAAANTNVAATGIRPEPEFPQEGAYDVLAFYSNWGASVELAAPGGDLGPDFDPADPESPVAPEYLVLSPFVDLDIDHPDEIPECVLEEDCEPGFAFAGGTSMAAPHVSGVAGLVRDEFPGLNANQVANRLTWTAESLGDRQLFGHGMVDAHEAVTR